MPKFAGSLSSHRGKSQPEVATISLFGFLLPRLRKNRFIQNIIGASQFLFYDLDFWARRMYNP